VLDRTSAERIIGIQPDTFAPSADWLVWLREQLLESIHSADIIGVRGVDHRSHIAEASGITNEQIAIKLHRDPRGYSGVIRSEYFMLGLASQGILPARPLPLLTSTLGYFRIFGVC
jgi:hypothetical protein